MRPSHGLAARVTDQGRLSGRPMRQVRVRPHSRRPKRALAPLRDRGLRHGAAMAANGALGRGRWERKSEWRRSGLVLAVGVGFGVGVGLGVGLGSPRLEGRAGPWGDSLATFRRRVARNLPPRPGPTPL